MTLTAAGNDKCEEDTRSKLKIEKKGNMRSVMGFEYSDFHSWSSFNQWLHQAKHPSNLATLRVAFGKSWFAFVIYSMILIELQEILTPYLNMF
jgi:hypothetical protein